jgi:subtilisin family serine protease
MSAVTQPSPELAKIGAQLLKVPRGKVLDTVASLRQGSLVEFAEPNYLVEASDAITPTTPNDPFWSAQWGPPDIQAPLAWSVTTGTASVVIAVIDTGIDLTHPDLAPNIWTNPGETGLDAIGNDKRINGIDDDADGYVDDWQGWNFVAGSNNPQDDYGHGTHVSGIAAAVGNNSLGIAGMAWGVRIMALKILDSSGSGSDSDLATAMIYATDHGARVINLSLGDTIPDPVMEDAVNYAYAHGVTVVAAAGNDYQLGVRYPAAYPNAIAVASVDSNNNHSSFSNWGPQIDIAAPGSNIYSTCWGGGYCYKTGTSMATPHVAGTAALLASLPQFNTPDQIRAALQDTALDLGTPGWDDHYGYGLVEAYYALRYYYAEINPTTAFRFVPAGSVVTYSLNISNTGFVTDSYTVTLNSGANFTATITPDLISDLAPATAGPVTVTVAIPDAASKGMSEAEGITITSQTVPSVQATAALTTTVPYTYILLLIMR